MKYKVEYTDELDSWVGGRCKLPIFPYFGLGTCTIQIRPKYKDDLGILNHELKHAEQYSKNWFHALKYKYSNDYRLEAELEAYKEQIKTYNYTDIRQCKWIIDALINKYNLKVTPEYVTAKLEEFLC